MKKHCISIIPGSSQSPVERLIAEEDPHLDIRERTPEVDGSGDPYDLLLVYTYQEISRETELAVDQLPSVIVSTFNIEEED